MRRAVFIALAAVALLGVTATGHTVSGGTAEAARPGFVFPAGCCYQDGAIVRTVVPPAAFPNEGIDPFYAVTNGVSGQKPVVAVAPGDAGYHGGHWKFFAVTFKGGVTPHLLTSD